MPPVANPGVFPKIVVPTIKFGLHCQYNAKHEMIKDFAERNKGKVAGFVVINETKLANDLINMGHFVVYRVYIPPNSTYKTDWLDYAPESVRLTYKRDWLANKGNDPEGARLCGQWFYQYGNERSWINQVDKRAVIKLVNECGWHKMDWSFWIGVMEAAEADGRRLAIFGDSYGTPEIDQWQYRIPALRHAKANGHFVVLNTYGVDDDKGYEWLGGRYRKFYDAVPDDARPYLIFGEAGVNDGYSTDPQAVDKLMAYSDKIARDRYGNLVVLSAAWTTGLWQKCSLDGQLPRATELLAQRSNPPM